ncbi:MAG: hypothetical protein ACOYKD_07735 [Anaerolineaceae bacterium]
MKTDLAQAYKQAPWRTQLQWIGTFLLVLVIVAAIAGIYLSISGRTAATGRRIQVLESDIEDLELKINDLSTQLAQESSAKTLYERLKESNMVEIDPLQALYIEVPGYQPRSALVMAPPPDVNTISSPTILPEFTSSLWDWLKSRVWEAPVIVTPQALEVQP